MDYGKSLDRSDNPAEVNGLAFGTNHYCQLCRVSVESTEIYSRKHLSNLKYLTLAVLIACMPTTLSANRSKASC